jgi:site-specific recombinase XerD
MAQLREEKHSPFYYVRYKDLETGRWRDKSTKLRLDTPSDRLKARKLCDEYSSREAQVGPQDSGNFSNWVSSFLKQHYQNPNSLKRYSTAWGHIIDFLKLYNLRHPAQLKYIHANIYVEWRKKEGVKHNSARLEVKLLSFILNEAIRREIITTNPLALAKIAKEASEDKPEISHEQFKAIQKALLSKPPWMNLIFHVCAYTGVRYGDGNITMSQVDFKNNTILLNDSKRQLSSKKKKYLFPLSGPFKSFLRKFFQKNPAHFKKLVSSDNTQFNKVMKTATGIANMTSHCNRVTFVTGCHRSGVSERQSKLLVNHSSSLVQDIYSKLNLEDKKNALSQLNLHS